MNAILADPEVRESLLKQGLNPTPGKPEDLARMIDTDLERWTKIVRAAQIRPRLDGSRDEARHLQSHLPAQVLRPDAQGRARAEKDIHKRVRAIPAIVDLDARFRIMDRFGDYAQVICLGSPPIEVFGPPPASTDMARLANDGMAELVRRTRNVFRRSSLRCR